MSSCVKPDSIDEQAADKIVIEATLTAGQSVEEIRVHGLRGVINDGPKNAIVKISDGEESHLLAPMDGRPGYYAGQSDFIISEEHAYQLTVEVEGKTAAAVTNTPPHMGLLSSSREYIDTEINGDLVFLEWSNVNTGSFNQYFYVIELIPEEDNPEAIIRFNASQSKSTLISYAPELTLSTDDFNFYGDHVIRVFAVDKAYEYLFAPQADAGQNGPSNIQGGYGYFIGTSMVDSSLEIR